MKNTITLLLLAVMVSLFIPADAAAQRRSRPQPQQRAVIDSSANPDAGKPQEAQSVYAYAVLIGVNKYRQPDSDNELEFPSLKCCVNDMSALRAALVKAKFAKEQDITLLSDDSDGLHKPTTANIQRCLNEVNAKAKPGDIVLVAFSGHGIALPVTKNGVTTFQSYLCPADTKIVYDGDNKEWNTGGNLIPIKELFDSSVEKEEVFKIAILDACRNTAPTIDGDIVKTANHTAAVPDELLVAQRSVKFRGGAIVNPENVAFAEEDLMSLDNLVRFSSCRKGQQSLEDKKEGHGIFTKFVLEALRGKADEQTVTDGNGKKTVSNGDGEINFFELTDYVTRNTQGYVKEQYGGEFVQKPSMSASETSAAVVMGYTGATRENIDLDNRRTMLAKKQSVERLEQLQRAKSIVDKARQFGAPIPAIPAIPGLGRW
ncbi:hypothetical protein FACS1894170_05640 [Planctomycetales bacterium]|nr:hypothetical protein FACS1894170_05640 [Planctomycetales bacterium]